MLFLKVIRRNNKKIETLLTEITITNIVANLVNEIGYEHLL